MTLAHEQTPQQQLTARLDELACDLDGFPVQALMADCLDPEAASPALSDHVSHHISHHISDHTRELVDRVLDRWIRQLGQDIDRQPPPTMDVLVAIGHRTEATRQALIEVRRLFDRLAQADAHADAHAYTHTHTHAGPCARDATAALSAAGMHA